MKLLFSSAPLLPCCVGSFGLTIVTFRYKSCLPVVGEEYRNGTHYFTGLKEGDKPIDRISGKPLPQGTVICDGHGVTTVVDEEGKVSYTAYTGNRDVVQARLKRFRGSQYSQPVNTAIVENK